MTPYLIIYSCKNSVKKFKSTDAIIKECSWDDRWMYHLNNTWIIKSEMTADEIGQRLNDIAENDDFLVVEIVNNYAGCLPEEAFEYLQNNIFNEMVSQEE